jgi:hypothetical protein
MNEPILLSGFSNVSLVDLRYHLDQEDFMLSSIELIIMNSRGKIRHLKFEQISNLTIENGFNGNVSGMVVVDIKGRQWSHSNVEVQNFEQDPGITFLAKNMKVLINEFNI